VTPLIALDRIAPDLWMKDEGGGATGCWLDRVPGERITLDDILHPPALTADVLRLIAVEIAEQVGPDAVIVTEAATAVPVRAAIDAGLEVLHLHGFLPSIRGAMALVSRPQTGPVVVINPESGFRDLHVYARRFPHVAQSETDKLGGLITPR
jgi:hypothetical protein